MFDSESIKAPEPPNRLFISVFFFVPDNLTEYTSLGAEFLDIYFANKPSFVNLTSKFIATTLLPVPGPPSTIRTCFLFGLAFLAIAKALSKTTFWSSIITNSSFPFNIEAKLSANCFEGLKRPFSMRYKISLLSPYLINFLMNSRSLIASGFKKRGAFSICSE